MADRSRMIEPEIICIIGMHRSGTSLVARIVNLLGVCLGPQERLHGAAPENAKGFWENQDIVWLNEEIFSRFGVAWDSPMPLPPDWHSGPQIADLEQCARTLIRELFDNEAIWGWKDPRSSIVLPFWQRLLPPMLYVICIRNPVSVALSLERRDGFSFHKSVDLWMTYVTSALKHTTGKPRLMIFYEDVMDDWRRELRRLADFLGRPEIAERADVLQAVESFVERDMQHNGVPLLDSLADPSLPFPTKSLFMLQRLYVNLQQARSSGHGRTDEDIQLALDAFANYSIEAQRSEQILLSRLDEQRQALETLEAQLAEKETQLSKITKSLGWRLLSIYGRRIKYPYLLPLCRRLGFMSPKEDGSSAKRTGYAESTGVYDRE
jgi:hypothetical protein